MRAMSPVCSSRRAIYLKYLCHCAYNYVVYRDTTADRPICNYVGYAAVRMSTTRLTDTRGLLLLKLTFDAIEHGVITKTDKLLIYNRN